MNSHFANVKLINISIDNAKRHEVFRIINHVAQQQKLNILAKLIS